MKRSEVLHWIKLIISYNNPSGYVEDGLPEELLETLEDLGMKPPPYVSGEGVIGYQFSNGWEPEDAET